MKAWMGSILLGSVAGILVAVAVNYGEWPSSSGDSSSGSAVAEAVQRDSIENDPAIEAAMRYAQSVRDGDGEVAAAMTQWMADRLERVRLESGDDEAVEQERERLEERAVERSLEGNQLQVEGIEDAYVFAPGSTLEFIRTDGSSQGLERPVQRRVWLRVTYPSPMRALLDTQGRPIRSLVAGVNVSNDGMVLKAGVVGNVEIDYRSLSYEWFKEGRTSSPHNMEGD